MKEDEPILKWFIGWAAEDTQGFFCLNIHSIGAKHMIQIEHLTHTYQSEQGKNIALNNLSLEINEGEHLAVLG